MGLGPWEIIIIFVVVLLLFGGKKLPEFARGLGEGIKEFKKATNDKGRVSPARIMRNTRYRSMFEINIAKALAEREKH